MARKKTAVSGTIEEVRKAAIAVVTGGSNGEPMKVRQGNRIAVLSPSEEPGKILAEVKRARSGEPHGKAQTTVHIPSHKLDETGFGRGVKQIANALHA